MRCTRDLELSSPSRDRWVSAFTLIEVLVVVGIVALLVAILTPSLAVARQQARAAVCANNIRQIGMGWHMYAQQSQDSAVAGRFPKIAGSTNLYWVGNGWKYRARWYAMLGAQVRLYAFSKPSPDSALDNTQPVDGEMFLDPEAREYNNSRNYPYGYNFQFLGNSRKRFSGGATDWIHWPVKTGQIKAPARTVMAADSLGTAASTPVEQRKPYDPTGAAANTDPARILNHAWALDPPRLTVAGDFCDDNLRGQARSAPDERHRGKANVVFTDNHVERLGARQLGYVVNPDGTVPLTGAGHNALFSGTGRDADPPSIQ
ncbi:MAG TPA: prepilin-type N-terminal cleavage/methylation domain-containing protein [Phycisphaerae bacterium]|nr:prepilin-type N-terminal cleavage/methylation domain-containing protein [Phycisphaerae bacterium]HRY68883.1 prepilin-type N-terminal cleavage/methylation domain-containing protein [Phycisphaerae bacterium]HSA25710.1 prepilin-type N-terminal cleavage/methylation domain-containing protein [Phycisphaerae bacterium]